MNDDLAGFGIPDFLPLRTRQALRSEERRELAEAREAEVEREQRAELKRSGALALYAEQAAERGEFVSAHALATGQVGGRTLDAILAGAEAMADIDDRREAARERREAGERLNLCFGETSRARPETREGRETKNVVRHFADEHPDADVIDRAIVAYEARKAQRKNRPVI